jgi:oligopeptide transport system ATP-binding protein
MTETILEVEGLKVYFPVRRGAADWGKAATLKAVEDVSFTLGRGETLGIVGESGCGKSTLGRAVLQLVKPTSGRVVWLGQDLGALDAADLRAHRRDLQIVFQDPLASLDPRMTVGEIIAEPLKMKGLALSAADRRIRVSAIMEKVGLSPALINRYPHEFSGGQCQRIGIARAMVVEPKLIVCDEPVSSLDVSIRAQIVNLLKDLQREFGLSLLFISHDLSVVRHVASRILVLYLGRVMEIGGRDDIFARPLHPYTKALIGAVLAPDPSAHQSDRSLEERGISGELPSPINPPSGCVFRTRCPIATEICGGDIPVLRELHSGHEVACYHAVAEANGLSAD